MRIWTALLPLMGILLTACTTNEVFQPVSLQPPAPPPTAFVHLLATPEVEIYWNCTRSQQAVLLFDGIAKNIGPREVRFLELRVSSVGTNDLLQDAASLPEIILYRDVFSPFHLQLPITGTEARIDLLYHYALAAPVYESISPILPEKQSTAHDVCSQTQYLAR